MNIFEIIYLAVAVSVFVGGNIWVAHEYGKCDFADAMGMFLTAVFWPIVVVWKTSSWVGGVR